jgi:hypothetical protein
MKTRSKAPANPAKRTEPLKKVLEKAETPCLTFILPTKTSPATKFLNLPNPSTGSLNRYLFCPEAGLYEFTAVTPPPQSPRSILFAPKGSETTVLKGTIAKKAELLVATPVDAMFFMLPILSPAATSNAKKLFQPLDDILDSLEDLSPHLRHILYDETFRPTLERKAESVCDTMAAGDEKLYRFSEAKLVGELLAKAERMVRQGLPTSLEQHFVRKELEAPLMSVKRTDAMGTTVSVTEIQDTDISEETQSTTTTTTTAMSEPSGLSTPATEVSSVGEVLLPSENDVARLLRIRIAVSFIKSSYLPPHLSAVLDEILKSGTSPVDFKPLDERLKHLAELRAEAVASRSVADYTRKRGLDDDEMEESRAEKKRRKEEEEKKKKVGESRGVRDLKKVNTVGMKKMSDFFKKT